MQHVALGLDSFAMHPLNVQPLVELAWAHDHGFAGVQFGDIHGLTPRGDPGPARELKQQADAQGMYTHVGVGAVNPCCTQQPHDQLVAALTARVTLATGLGWHELHGVMGGPHERFELPESWPTQLAASTAVLVALRPVLRAQHARINLETHADANTFELVRMIETVGPDVLGVCFDTANVVLHGETPLAAARRVAPYVHMVHLKDILLSFVAEGLRRQSVPPGSGLIDWPTLLGILLQAQPDLPLSIEDHKWLFDAALYSPAWRASNCDVSRDEILDLIQLAYQGEQRMRNKLAPWPEDSETIPYADQMEQRLTAARAYLRGVVDALP